MSDLGVYDVFKKIVLRPFIIFYNSIEQVVFSMLSKVQNEDEEFKNMFESFSKSINLLIFPLIAFVFLNSEYLIYLFPEAYHGYLMTLKWFSFLIFSIMILNPLDLLLYTKGKSKKFLKWMSFYIFPFLLVLWYSASYNLNTLIIACACFYLLLFIIAYFVLIKTETPLDFNSYFNLWFWWHYQF